MPSGSFLITGSINIFDNDYSAIQRYKFFSNYVQNSFYWRYLCAGKIGSASKKWNKMFKEIYKTTILLIFKPSEAWVRLRNKRTEDHERFLADFVYPFIGMITVAAFLGILFTRKEFDLQIALKAVIMTILSAFGGFFLASYLLNELWHSMFHRERNMKLCQRFVGYSSVLMFSLNIILCLFPNFFFLRFFVLYTIVIVWEGAIPYMEVDGSVQLKFVVCTTIIVLFMPMALAFIFERLMPGLRF